MFPAPLPVDAMLCTSDLRIRPLFERQLHVSTSTFTTHQNRVCQARGLDDNPITITIHSLTPVRISFQQLYLKIPASGSPLAAGLLRGSHKATGEDAGACLAMNKERNSPICPISSFPNPLSALC